MIENIPNVTCSTCGKTVEWSQKSPFRPFCCKRCQLIDLGEWAAEKKRISSKMNIADSENWNQQ